MEFELLFNANSSPGLFIEPHPLASEVKEAPPVFPLMNSNFEPCSPLEFLNLEKSSSLASLDLDFLLTSDEECDTPMPVFEKTEAFVKRESSAKMRAAAEAMAASLAERDRFTVAPPPVLVKQKKKVAYELSPYAIYLGRIHALGESNVRRLEFVSASIEAGLVTWQYVSHCLGEGVYSDIVRRVENNKSTNRLQSLLAAEVHSDDLPSVTFQWDVVPQGFEVKSLSSRDQRRFDLKSQKDRVEFIHAQNSFYDDEALRSAPRHKVKQLPNFDPKRAIDELNSPCLSPFRAAIFQQLDAGKSFDQAREEIYTSSMKAFPRDKILLMRQLFSMGHRELAVFRTQRGLIPQGASQSTFEMVGEAASSTSHAMNGIEFAAGDISSFVKALQEGSLLVGKRMTELLDPTLLWFLPLLKAKTDMEAVLCINLLAQHPVVAKYCPKALVMLFAAYVFFAPGNGPRPKLDELVPQGESNPFSSIINSPIAVKIGAFIAAVTAGSFTSQLAPSIQVMMANWSESVVKFRSNFTVMEVATDLCVTIFERLSAFSASGDLTDLFGKPREQAYVEEMEAVMKDINDVRTQKIGSNLPEILTRAKALVLRSLTEKVTDLSRGYVIRLQAEIISIQEFLKPERTPPIAMFIAGDSGTGKSQLVSNLSRMYAKQEGIPEVINIQFDMTHTKHQQVPVCVRVVHMADAFQIKEECCEVPALNLLQGLADSGVFRFEAASIPDKARSSVAPAFFCVTTNAKEYTFSAATGGLNKLNRRFLMVSMHWTKKAIELSVKNKTMLELAHRHYPGEPGLVQYRVGTVAFPATGNEVKFVIDKELLSTESLAEVIQFMLDQESKRNEVNAPVHAVQMVNGKVVPVKLQGSAQSDATFDNDCGLFVDENTEKLDPLVAYVPGEASAFETEFFKRFNSLKQGAVDLVKRQFLNPFTNRWEEIKRFDVGARWTRLVQEDLTLRVWKRSPAGGLTAGAEELDWYWMPEYEEFGAFVNSRFERFLERDECLVLKLPSRPAVIASIFGNQTDADLEADFQRLYDETQMSYFDLLKRTLSQPPSYENFKKLLPGKATALLFGATFAGAVVGLCMVFKNLQEALAQAHVGPYVAGIPVEFNDVPEQRTPAVVWLKPTAVQPVVKISRDGLRMNAILVLKNMLHVPAHFFRGTQSMGVGVRQGTTPPMVDGELITVEHQGVSTQIKFVSTCFYADTTQADAGFYVIPSLPCSFNNCYAELIPKTCIYEGPGDINGHPIHFSCGMAKGYETIMGDCGLPYRYGGKIVGVHWAIGANEDKPLYFTNISQQLVLAVAAMFAKRGFEVPIHKTDINEALAHVIAQAAPGTHPRSDGGWLERTEGWAKSDHIPLGHIPARDKPKMTGRPTTMREAFTLEECPEHLPPNAGKAILVGDKWVSPVVKRHAAMQHSSLHDELLVQRSISAMLERIPSAKLSPLTLHQAICGDPRHRLISPKDNTKSIGPTLANLGVTKKNAFVKVDDHYDVHPEYMKEYTRLLTTLKDGHVPISVTKASLKDELYTAEQVKAGKSRFFYVQDSPLNMIGRQWVLPLLIHLLEHPVESGVVGTLNAGSLQWTRLYEHLTKFGLDRIIDIDQTTYDLKHSVLMNPYARYMRRLALKCGYSEEDAWMVFRILCAMATYILIMEGNFFLCGTGLTSGRIDTLVANCIMSMMAIYYAYFLKGLDDPDGDLGLANTGDDNVTCVREGVDFCGEDIRKGEAELNYVVTAADKKSVIEFKNIKDIRYLKRSWVWRDIEGIEGGGAYMAPLALNSILKSLCYCVGVSVADETERNWSALSSATRELWMHERSVWDEYYPRFVALAANYSNRPLPSWEQLTLEYVHGTFCMWDSAEGFGLMDLAAL
jgi:hypothetical protein